MLKSIKLIIERIERDNIKACHWKSNNNLEETVSGVGDVDLLVNEKDKLKFESLIYELGFLKTVEPFYNEHMYMFHYYGVDVESGVLIHLHVYYRLITGGSIVKAHEFDDSLVFDNLIQTNSFKIPAPEIEIILLVLRKFIEHRSVIENLLLKYDYKNVLAELSWLEGRAKSDMIRVYLSKYFPEVAFIDFSRALKNMSQADERTRQKDARVIVKNLKHREIYGRCRVEFMRCFYFGLMILRSKLLAGRTGRNVAEAGVVISFIGSEASGKTTLGSNLYNFLSTDLITFKSHCGKPPATVFTYIFRKLLPLMVRVKRLLNSRGNNKSIGSGNEALIQKNRPHFLVSFADSVDRYFLCKRLNRLARTGAIIITDRYPSKEYDMIDGPRIEPKGVIKTFLGRIERRLYSKIPSPDLIVKVFAPLDVTIARNAERALPEPELFVKERYAQFHSAKLPSEVEILSIDTTQPLSECMKNLQMKVWEVLGSKNS